MQHLKAFVAGAAIVYLSGKLASLDAVQNASPTLAKYAPYIAGGGLLVVAHHFSKGV